MPPQYILLNFALLNQIIIGYTNKNQKNLDNLNTLIQALKIMIINALLGSSSDANFEL